MPLYYDLRTTARKRCLTGSHLELAMQFLEAIRGQNYLNRGYVGDTNELSVEDLTDDVVITWALIRDWLAPNEAHIHFQHRDGLSKDHNHREEVGMSENGEEMESMGHGHMTPPLFLLADAVKDKSTTNHAVIRARRDLEGFVGMRTSAARGKFPAEEVFGDE